MILQCQELDQGERCLALPICRCDMCGNMVCPAHRVMSNGDEYCVLCTRLHKKLHPWLKNRNRPKTFVRGLQREL